MKPAHKKLLGLILLVFLVLTLGGCRKSETKPGGIIVVGETELEKDINELDSIDQNLNTSDLDDLDQDLENVTW